MATSYSEPASNLAMAAHPQHVEPFRHFWLGGGRLIVSYCSACGLVVAASPRESALQLAESIHVCPVYLNYYGDS